MEILKILEESGKNLYIEDLDFFETELATGGLYDAAYQTQCRSKIKELRAWIDGGEKNTSEEAAAANSGKEGPDVPKGLVVGFSDLAPKSDNPSFASMSPADIIRNDLQIMRENSTYKTAFKQYVKEKDEIDAAFVDAHYSLFQPWELDAIISAKQMGEEFLEKYFGALDHDKIARYQLFSESFFMKHFSQMDASVVLEHGKNEWRKKESRSKQLDVFLRLKGVKL